MHLEAHAGLIADCQVEHQVVPADGAVIRLAPGIPAIVGEVHAGRLGLDGERLIALDGDAMRGRHRMLVSGAAVATVVLDADGRLAAEPRVSLLGLSEGEDGGAEEDLVVQAVRAAVGRIPARLLGDDAAVGEAVRIAVRRAVRALTGKKPVAAVHVVRVGG
jgi:ribonuclease J